MKIKVLTILLLMLLLSPLSALAASAEEIMPANLTINQNTVWSGRKILNGSQIRVESGVTLTLLPGTTLISNNGAMLYVLGRLVALGEEDKKIRFTANPLIKQSSSLNFFIESGAKSEIELKNFILERGGGNQGSASLPAMTIRGAALMDRGIIKRNKITAIRNWGVNFTLKRSDIYENENLALENKSAVEIKAEENWWGEDGGPNQGGSSLSGKTVGTIDSKPWEDKGPMPIIFLPGIGGSLSFRLFNDKFHDYWFLTPFGTGAYRDFVKNLILSGYQYEKNFFWGFYDWRLSNGESARLYLKKLIDEIKTKNKHYEVSLVAHSMGGLMARSYIQSDFFENDVDRLVTLGTPHLGSSDVYSIWEGEEFPEDSEAIELYLWFLKKLEPDLDQNSIIRKEFPSIGEMLPIYDHFLNVQSGSSVSYAQQKRSNYFLEDLKNKEFLTAERVTADLMAGTGEATLEKIPVDLARAGAEKWREGRPDPLPPAKDIAKGDGRVTEKSALADGEIGGTSTLQSDHSALPAKAKEKIFSQMKIRLKNPWVTSSMEYFIFGLSGLVDVILKDELGRSLSLSKKEIPESLFEGSGSAEGKKLVYAEVPIEQERSGQKMQINLTGQSEGRVDFAVWTVSEKGRTRKDFEKQLKTGVELNLGIGLDRKSDGGIEPIIISEKYYRTVSFLHPRQNEKILNWQTLRPNVDFIQLGNVFNDEKIDFWLDEKPLNGDKIDLSKINLGKHRVAVRRSVANKILDESEVEFEVESSIKSLITVLNQDFKRGELSNEREKNIWLNDLALSYQFLSNRENAFALDKLDELANKISQNDEVGSEEKEKILTILKAIRKNPS